MSKNPYEILHLEEDASYQEIKERYRHLTRNLHPDKQPLENYQASKQIFEQIDEAYKSIASPLRRRLFKEFGMAALTIYEDQVAAFAEFEGEELTPSQVKQLRQLMIYMLYEREASTELDRNKFVTRTVMNLSKPLKTLEGRQRKSLSSKVPQIENYTCEYETVLPQWFGFSNSVAFSQVTTHLKNDPKYTVGLTFAASRRILTNYMVSLQGSVASDKNNFDFSIDRILAHNTVLKLSPLSFTNGQMNRPRVGIEKPFDNFQVVASTDMDSMNLEFSESAQKKTGKSLKLFLQNNTLGLVPKIEWQLDHNLRFYIQVNINAELNPVQRQISLNNSLVYGYKLTLSNDLKLELVSTIGAVNYFQLSFISNKYRASLPAVAPDINFFRWELYKMGLMVMVYFSLRTAHYTMRRNAKTRERKLKEEESRLNEQKRELNRQIGYAEMATRERKEYELSQNGLVIVRAYLGQPSKIKQVRDKLNKIHKPKTTDPMSESAISITQAIDELQIQVGDASKELEDVTGLIQGEVRGAQIISYDLQTLHAYNPCLYQQTMPHLVLAYLLRGELIIQSMPCRKTLNIGGIYKSSWSKVGEWAVSVFDWVLSA